MFFIIVVVTFICLTFLFSMQEWGEARGQLWGIGSFCPLWASRIKSKSCLVISTRICWAILPPPHLFLILGNGRTIIGIHRKKTSLPSQVACRMSSTSDRNGGDQESHCSGPDQRCRQSVLGVGFCERVELTLFWELTLGEESTDPCPPLRTHLPPRKNLTNHTLMF